MQRTFLSTTETMRQLGVSLRRVMTLLYENKLPGAYKLGNLWQIPAGAVEARLKAKHAREGA